MQEKTNLVKTFFTGIAMGAADVIPGVSGGTIAFISGIYERLLGAIGSVKFSTTTILRKEGIAAAWKSIDGTFLAVLLSGIVVSIASLARLVTYLMDEHPVLLWSFFFGLIVASVPLIGKQVTKWDLKAIAFLILGTGISYYITIAEPSTDTGELWYIFIASMLAICAMILPGISGSFILLLLGAYVPVMTAIKELDIAVVLVVVAGAVIGLLSFSKLLKWTFANYHNITIAALTGFLVGSLNKIWPWKETISERTNSKGEVVPFIQENVLPGDYVLGEPQVLMAIVVAVIGFAVIFILERFGAKKAA